MRSSCDPRSVSLSRGTRESVDRGLKLPRRLFCPGRHPIVIIERSQAIMERRTLCPTLSQRLI